MRVELIEHRLHPRKYLLGQRRRLFRDPSWLVRRFSPGNVRSIAHFLSLIPYKELSGEKV
jgi:hypothetical protein